MTYIRDFIYKRACHLKFFNFFDVKQSKIQKKFSKYEKIQSRCIIR